MLNRLNANGITIAYRDLGSGAPLIFIHGNSYESSTWDAQALHFCDRYRVIAPDVRGHGSTTIATWGYSVPTLAQDLLGLMDGLGVERAVVCGLSLGGIIAMQAAVDAPHRFAGLILADTTARAGQTPEAGLAIAQRLASYFDKGHAAFADFTGQVFYSETHRAAHPDFAERWRARYSANNFFGVTGTTLAIFARPPILDRLATLPVPTLVICGRQDVVTPLDASEELAATIPNAKLVVIENCGHLSNEEQPAAFNDAVDSFLRAINWS
ncbi:MAG: alpha/beta fold hydrolase [Dehalococcoidia bacterium]|nr:alpha/beta fold hydrolase [Dehalococcoidia bacterium]